jgi:hypothetical protein
MLLKKGGIISMNKRILVFALLLCFASASVFALTLTKQASKLTWPVEMHGLVVSTTGYAFTIGGYAVDSIAAADWYAVYSAPIDASGIVGSWMQVADVSSCSNDPGAAPNSAYIEFSCFEANGYVYRIGGGWNWGNAAGSNNGDSLWGKIGSGGNITSWGKLTPFPTSEGTGGLWCPGTYAVVSGITYVYAVSGQPDVSAVTPKVFMAVANPATGALNSWTEVANVPAGMWFNAAFAAGNKLYTLGGLTTGSSNSGKTDDIYKTTINGDGTLQPWTTLHAPTEMFGLYGPAVAASKHVVYVIGGRRFDGAAACSMDSVWRATISPSGDLGTFTYEGELLVGSTLGALKYTPAVIHTVGKQERIYMIGARVGINGVTTNLVNDPDWDTDAYGISSAVFYSGPVYTLPTAIGSGSFNPGQIKVYSVSDGTGPYTWISSNTAAIRINSFAGNTAVVEAIGIGSATVTVSDAYSDTDSIAASVIATGAPLFKEVEPRKYIRFELFN